MSARRLAAPALAALALAAPSSALAQGAGDEQYTDPFGTQQGDSGSGGGSTETPAPASTPAPAAAPSEASPPASSAAPESASLPRTGADAALVALLGAGLVLTGAGLRMRVRVD